MGPEAFRILLHRHVCPLLELPLEGMLLLLEILLQPFLRRLLGVALGGHPVLLAVLIEELGIVDHLLFPGSLAPVEPTEHC